MGKDRHMYGHHHQQQNHQGKTMMNKRNPIKVKYISSPMKVKAGNPTEFRAIVQELTGKNSEYDATWSEDTQVHPTKEVYNHDHHHDGHVHDGVTTDHHDHHDHLLQQQEADVVGSTPTAAHHHGYNFNGYDGLMINPASWNHMSPSVLDHHHHRDQFDKSCFLWRDVYSADQISSILRF